MTYKVISMMNDQMDQEIKMPSKGGTTYGAVVRTAERFKAHLDRLVSVEGITGQQYNVLRILRGAGSDGLPTLTIAERLIEQTPGITRMIDRLSAKDLVDRITDQKDRRRVFCRLTQKGIAVLDRLDQVVERNNTMLDGLSEDQIDLLIDLLGRLEINQKRN